MGSEAVHQDRPAGPMDAVDGSNREWEACLQVAGILGQPSEPTRAIAALLFGVWQDIRSFDDLQLEGTEPAVGFFAGWRGQDD